MSEKVQIRVEDVLQMLKDGKTRGEIGEYYGLNGVNTKKLFLHPELKYKKTHKELPFEVIGTNDVFEDEVLEVPFEEDEVQEQSVDEAEEDTVHSDWENA